MYSKFTVSTKSVVSQRDLGMFSVFGRTGAPQKEAAYKPKNVGQQRDIFWPVMAFFVACCETDLAQHDNLCPINIIRLLNSESHISNQVIAPKLRTFVTLNSW